MATNSECIFVRIREREKPPIGYGDCPATSKHKYGSLSSLGAKISGYRQSRRTLQLHCCLTFPLPRKAEELSGADEMKGG